MTVMEKINKLENEIAIKHNFQFNQDGSVEYKPKPEKVETMSYYSNRISLGNGNYKKVRHLGAE